MASLSAMPNELLILIFDNLANSELGAISRTNKGFHRTVEPFLYRNIRLKMKGTFTYTYSPIPLLLRSIWNRPELAKYIINVDIKSEERPWGEYPEDDNTSFFTEREEQSLITFIESFPFELKDEWVSQIQGNWDKRSFDAYFALLLSQLPNVKIISLADEFWNIMDFLGSMFQTASHQNSQPALDDGGFSTPTQDSDKRRYGIFDLPSLTDLSVAWSNVVWNGYYGVVHIEPLVWPETCSQQTKITNLDITVLREQNSAEALVRILKLHKLRWEFWEPGQDSPDVLFDCEALAKALTHVKGSLEDLAITTSYERLHNRLIHGVQRRHTSKPEGRMNLSNFNNLRRLEVPLMTLLGPENEGHLAEVLPKYAEHIIFNTDGVFKSHNFDSWYWEPEELVKEFQTWLLYGKETPSRLKRVEIRWLAEWGPDALRSIELLFTEAGLRYAINFVLKNSSDYKRWGSEWERRDGPWHSKKFKAKRQERHYKITDRKTFDSLHTHVLRPTERELQHTKIAEDRKRDRQQAHEADDSDDGSLNIDLEILDLVE